MTEAQLLKRAKALALAQLNTDRAAANLPPLARVERLWWSLYSAEWIAKAKAQPEPLKLRGLDWTNRVQQETED